MCSAVLLRAIENNVLVGTVGGVNQNDRGVRMDGSKLRWNGNKGNKEVGKEEEKASERLREVRSRRNANTTLDLQINYNY